MSLFESQIVGGGGRKEQKCGGDDGGWKPLNCVGGGETKAVEV